MFLHMSIHMPQASTSSSLTSCVCASSDSLSGAAIWPPVQYDHLCNMATRAVRSLVQWGQLCDIASCAVWPPGGSPTCVPCQDVSSSAAIRSQCCHRPQATDHRRWLTAHRTGLTDTQAAGHGLFTTCIRSSRRNVSRSSEKVL